MSAAAASESPRRPIAEVHESGYTLIELLVATALLGVVMGAVYGLLFNSQLFHERETAEQSVRQSARNAFSRMVGEIRLAGYALENVPAAIVTASEAELTFAGDIDNGAASGDCTDEAGASGVERVSYRLSAGVLSRSVACWDGGTFGAAGAPSVILRSVTTTAAFRYFDRNGVELVPGTGGLDAAQRDSVASVRVQLHVREAAPNGAAANATHHPESGMEGQVVLRNALFSP